MNDNKHPLKSKTILFIVVTFLAMMFNMYGPANKPVAEMTWEELEDRQGQGTEEVVDMLALFGLGGAAYGRIVAKKKIGADL